ncbi:MAG: hypothetical protein ACTSSH_08055 [Candidatus Heimdallarchaeota archaeon]
MMPETKEITPIAKVIEPVTTVKDFEKKWPEFKDKYPIFALFLYTDEDEEIVEYVRKNHKNLDKYSNNKCLIFLVDEPIYKNLKEDDFRDYLKDPKKTLPNIGISSKAEKVDRSEAIALATQFQIAYSNMPCLAFFKDIEEKKMITYKLIIEEKDEEEDEEKEKEKKDKDLTKQFREIFTVIMVKSKQTVTIEEGRKKIWKGLMKYKRRKKFMKFVKVAYNWIKVFVEIASKIADLITPGITVDSDEETS